MPVKTTTTRKRRSRKSTAKVSTTAQRIAAAVDKQEAKVEPKVITTQKPVVVKQAVKSAPKVTTTPKPVVIKQEVKIAPPSPKLSLRDYREDLQSRIAIHNYEVNNLIEDLLKGYNYFLPFGKKAYNFVTNLSAKWYSREGNCLPYFIVKF